MCSKKMNQNPHQPSVNDNDDCLVSNDTDDHNILLNKTFCISFDVFTYTWFKQYLSGRIQTVIPDGNKSGIPNGS